MKRAFLVLISLIVMMTCCVGYAFAGSSDLSPAQQPSADTVIIKVYNKNISKKTIKKKNQYYQGVKVTAPEGCEISFKKLSGSKFLSINSQTGKVKVKKHKCNKTTHRHSMKVRVTVKKGSVTYTKKVVTRIYMKK